MMLSYIINHRGKTGYRLENLLFLVDFIKDIKDIEIIIVEQDDIPSLSGFNFPSNCKYVFVKNTGLFNRSWGFNVGYKNSNSDNLLFGDNDVIMNISSFNNCYEKLSEHEIINPYSTIIDTTVEEAKNIRATKVIPDLKRSGRTGVNFSGGIVLFKRSSFESIGGWDEDFRGWGGEDDALSFYKIPKIIGSHKMMTLNNVAYHLWHERTVNDTHRHEHYGKNINKLNWYSKASKEDIIKSINLTNIGLEDKYEGTL